MVILEGHILLAARIVLGVVMVYYGWPKVRDLKSNSRDFVSMGFRPGWLWGTMVGFSEFFGGLLLIAGVYPELFAGLFGFQMFMGTFWKLKIHKPFSDYSYDILALIITLFIVMYGGGLFVFVPFTAFFLLRVDLFILAVAAAVLGAGLSRPKMK